MASGGPLAFTDVPSPPLPAQQLIQGGGKLLSFGGQPYWQDTSGGLWALTSAGASAVAWSSVSGLPFTGGTLTGVVSNTALSEFALDNFPGTDDQKMTAALTAVFAAPGGGTITLAARAHTFANQWSTSYSSGVVTTVRIIGSGAAPNSTLNAPATPAGATQVAFTYNGAGAGQMDFQHVGLIEIASIYFTDTVNTVPFFFDTNATAYVHDNSFRGTGQGLTCGKDALVFGGTGTSTGGGDTAKYNGYGSVVFNNYFDSTRAVCRFQSAANSIQVHDNTIGATCGNAGNFGAPFVFAANSAKPTQGNQIHDNLIEMVNYQAVGYAGPNAYALHNLIGPNGVWDNSYYVNLYQADSTSQYNSVDDRGFSTTQAYHRPIDPSQTTTLLSMAYSSIFGATAEFTATPLVRSTSYGIQAENQWGARATLASISSASVRQLGGAQVTISRSAEVVDGVTIGGTPFITSITAAFSLNSDLGAFIASSNGYVPQTTKILWVYTPSQPFGATWAASAAVALGQPAIPVTANGHLYQCTTAGTTGATQPAWPTSGGTVTDGTVVWTDLGTSATAALLSQNATTTGTGVIIFWGRSGGTITAMTQFINHHVIGSGSAPTWTATGAGTGYSATATGTDLGQILTLVTGTSSAAGIVLSGTAANVLYNTSGTQCITPANAAAASLMTAAAGAPWIVANGTTGWTLTIPGTPADATPYKFHILTLG